MGYDNQSSDNDPYNELCSNMDPKYRQEVIRIYQGYGAHYISIINSMSNKIFNWAFTLNTGGLAVTIAFIGATFESKLVSKTNILYILLTKVSPYSPMQPALKSC